MLNYYHDHIYIFVCLYTSVPFIAIMLYKEIDCAKQDNSACNWQLTWWVISIFFHTSRFMLWKFPFPYQSQAEFCPSCLGWPNLLTETHWRVDPGSLAPHIPWKLKNKLSCIVITTHVWPAVKQMTLFWIIFRAQASGFELTTPILEAARSNH